ncbi:hypothetical protein Mgra_00006731 [Meloidogyne graminicola]|uniref:Uncharacterized protein n=1 Tax=Meloidogyne graminicola TaxID=189291 RepID=A0A8S9ZKP7_9BILA|nr:hypothetical protein Mgra_00006731 [Meloidogyne graminicola]
MFIQIYFLIIQIIFIKEINSNNVGEKFHGGMNITLNNIGQCILNGKITNGELIVNNNYKDEEYYDCLENFDKLAYLNNCGTENYDLIAYCFKINFFGHFGIEIVNSNIMKPNYPKTIAEKEINYMQDKVLVLIDGCFKCSFQNINEEKIKINIKLIQIHPFGPIEEICPYEKIIINQLTFNQSKGSFIIGGILHERSCPSYNGKTVELNPLKYNHNIGLLIEHNCGQSPNSIIKDLKQLENNVFELRQLEINIPPKDKLDSINLNWDKKNKGGVVFFHFCILMAFALI